MCHILLYTFPFLCDKGPKPKIECDIQKGRSQITAQRKHEGKTAFQIINTAENPPDKDSDLIKQNCSHFPFCYRTQKPETHRITSSVISLEASGPHTCSKQSQLQSQIKSLEASSPSSLPTAFYPKGHCSQGRHWSHSSPADPAEHPPKQPVHGTHQSIIPNTLQKPPTLLPP